MWLNANGGADFICESTFHWYLRCKLCGTVTPYALVFICPMPNEPQCNNLPLWRDEMDLIKPEHRDIILNGV